jgi:phage terminase large subunit-like protein
VSRKFDKKRLEELSPEKQRLYQEKLERLKEYKRVNPLYYYNHPTLSAKPIHKKQIAFHSLRIRSKAFFGGNQSGKTTAGIADDLIQAVNIDILPKHLKPFKVWYAPFKCRIFTPDLSDTMLVVQDKIKDLVPLPELVGESWDSAYDKVNRFLRFKNGSWFQFMSYEQDIQKLGSATLHRIHYDEEPPRKVYEESQPRLMRYQGDQIFTMTPLQGMSWTYNDIWVTSGGNDDKSQFVFVNQKEKVASVIVDMDDNPFLTQEAKDDTLRDYDENTRKARKEGRFVHFAGLIYNEFSEKDHVDTEHNEKPLVIYDDKGNEVGTKNANVIVGIDPGLLTCAVEWVYVDEDNNMTVFEELYVSDWTIKEVCEQINKMNAYHRVKPIYYIIDPHARDRSKQTGRSDQSEFTKYGVYTILGQNAVQAGINEVKQRLKDRKLTILSSCPNLIREFKMYRWKEASNRGVEVDPEPAPIKKDDHALDALRYIVMSRPYAPRLEEEDTRNWHEKMLDEDKESYDGLEVANSEFGAVFL